MRVALLSPKWGGVNILRQTKLFSGITSSAQFCIHPNDFNNCDYVIVPSEDALDQARSFSKKRRVHVCMENPSIWSPSLDFLSNIGIILTPFPEAIAGLSKESKIIQSYPCVPWFYDIEFSITSGLSHVPLKSRSDLGKLLSFPAPRKTKLLSVILSSKQGSDGYAWRIQLANALKKEFGDLLDIYGFGHNPLANKRDAIDPYLATIVLENCSHPYYITEKLADALLGWSYPIYCGSESISSLLPGYNKILDFGSSISACCSKVKSYIHDILLDSCMLSQIRAIALRRLNLFYEVPSLLKEV